MYIIDEVHSRACTGHLQLLPDKNKEKVLFVPVDHRVPRLYIPMNECPENFYARPQDFKSTLFVARILDWLPNGKMASG